MFFHFFVFFVFFCAFPVKIQCEYPGGKHAITPDKSKKDNAKFAHAAHLT